MTARTTTRFFLCLSVAWTPLVRAESCMAKYDPKNAVAVKYDKMAGGSLMPSSWLVCDGRIVHEISACGGQPVVSKLDFAATAGKSRVVVTGLPDDQVATLAAAQAHTDAGKMFEFYKVIIKKKADEGLPFDASLCLDNAGVPFVNLVGTGSVQGRKSKIVLTPAANGIQFQQDMNADQNGVAK